MPEVAVVAEKGQADLEIEFQRDDAVLCIDCGQLEYKTQYWHWLLTIMKPEFDPKCDSYISRPVGSLYGETRKLGEKAEKAAIRELELLIAKGRASASNTSLHRTPAAAPSAPVSSRSLGDF